MASDRGYDISQWYDSKPVKLGWLGDPGDRGVLGPVSTGVRVLPRVGLHDPGI